MPDTFTNLLPPERERALTHEYAFRVGVVAVALVTILAFIAALLLTPTYVFLSGSEQAKRTQLATVESKLSPADDTAFSARLTALTNSAEALIALSNTASISTIIRDALAVARPGITLSGFSYTPATSKKPGTLAISGLGATRDVLRNYQLALQTAPFVRTAALPVSAYAQDTDIAFTITLTLVP